MLAVRPRVRATAATPSYTCAGESITSRRSGDPETGAQARRTPPRHRHNAGQVAAELRGLRAADLLRDSRRAASSSLRRRGLLSAAMAYTLTVGPVRRYRDLALS